MDVRLYLVNVEKNPEEASRIASDAAKRIEDKQLKLLDVIQSMGEFMVDDDATVRAKSIGFLSAILNALDSKSLTRQQIAVITQFLSDRLEDETGLKEVAQGLIALLKMPRFSAEEAEKVTLALLKVDLRKHPQSTRFVVLSVLDELMGKHRDVLKQLGDQFIDGFIELVGGEKDPRNLMVIFSLLKVIIIEFDTERHTEALFDSVYVYYPITFTPPPNDPYGITAQDLKVRLRDCIAASPRFADHIFKPLIEKLDSTSQSVKKDVLQTMAACSLNYGPSVMANHVSSLWDAVKFEILNPADEELADEALITIRAFAKSLAYRLVSVPQPAAPLSRYLKAIVKECLELLKEPQQKQAKPAGQILASIAQAGAIPYTYIIKNTFPALLTVYDDSEGITKQRAMLEVFNQVFNSATVVYGEWGELQPYPILENPMAEFKEKLFDMYSKTLMGVNKEEVGFRIMALKGLGALSRIRRLFADNEVGMVVQYLDEVVLEKEEESREEIKEEALQGLLKISRMKPNLIMEITFPALMATLPDTEEEAIMRPYMLTLEALAKLSTERSVFEVLLTRLFNKLDVVIQYGSGPTYPKAILSTLLYVLHQKSLANHSDIPTFYDRLVPPLVTKTVVALITPVENGRKPVLGDELLLEVMGRLLNIVVRSLDVSKQEKVIQDAFNLFIHRKPSELVLRNREKVAEEFRPFGEVEGNGRVLEHAGCMTLFTWGVAGVRREVKLPIDDIPSFARQVKSTILDPPLAQFRFTNLRLLALIVNKWIPASSPSNSSTLELINALTEPSPSKENSIRINFWLAKALVMKGDKLADRLILDLVDLLADPKYGALAARGFAVLLGEDEVLGRSNWAVQRGLSRQKTFTLCVPRLVERFKSTSTPASTPAGGEAGTKPNYLVALASILKHVPSQIFLPLLPQLDLIPMLLQSLDLSIDPTDPTSVAVKLATLSTLSVTILESPEAVHEHIDSLIKRLLVAATYVPQGDGGPSPKVRKAALECLRLFPGAMRKEEVMRFKRRVVRGLVDAGLDDPRRGVRRCAVDCRRVWEDVGEEGEGEE
ncbi:RNAPII transcription regulator C-terminal-domain-containing protein [Kalaharituber pfeilii]|nr:RNAPII transcription regulator C-terminal-domain-containing protein [Kalaharituber pfeilii]